MFGEQVIGMVMWRREEKVGFEQGPWRFRTRIDFPHQGAKEQGARSVGAMWFRFC